MSAFAAGLGGMGGGGGGRQETTHNTERVEIDEANMNFWQRLQHKYKCCLIDIVVNFFCPTRELRSVFPAP